MSSRWWKGNGALWPGFGGGAAFSPSTTSPDVWYSASDMAANFQLSNGTTAAVVDSPIGYLGDKPDFTKNAIQATAGLRPILRQPAAVKTINFDGTDDLLVGPLLADCTTATAYYFVASGVFPTASADVLNAHSNDCLFCNVGTVLGLGVRSSGKIILTSHDGGYQNVEAAYTVGQSFVAEGWLSAGVLNPSVFLGRVFNLRATASRSL